MFTDMASIWTQGRTDDYYTRTMITDEYTMQVAVAFGVSSLGCPRITGMRTMGEYLINSVFLYGFIYRIFLDPIFTIEGMPILTVVGVSTDLLSYMMVRSQKTKSIACTVILYGSLLLIPTLDYFTVFINVYLSYSLMKSDR